MCPFSLTFGNDSRFFIYFYFFFQFYLNCGCPNHERFARKISKFLKLGGGEAAAPPPISPARTPMVVSFRYVVPLLFISHRDDQSLDLCSSPYFMLGIIRSFSAIDLQRNTVNTGRETFATTDYIFQLTILIV